MIIADSNIIIDFMRGRSPGADRLDEAMSIAPLAVTAVSVFEVSCGIRRDHQADPLRQLLSNVEVLPLDAMAALEGAAIRRHLWSKGEDIGLPDSLIAGICVVRGAPLLTGNQRHFARVRGLTLTPF